MEFLVELQKFLDANAGTINAILMIVGVIVTKLWGDKSKQKEILTGVVREVEAAKSPQVAMLASDALELAIAIAKERGVKAKTEKLAAMVQAAHDAEEKRRESEPPQQ